MTFDEIKSYVDELSAEDKQQLREYVGEQESLKAGTMNIDLLLEAVDKIREGMSQEEIDEMIALMNGKKL